MNATDPVGAQSEVGHCGNENSVVGKTVSLGCVPRSGLAGSKVLHF